MSLYRFLACDKEMPEYDNMHITPIFTDNEVSEIKFAPGTDEFTAMRINREDDFYYASQYTKKKYINYIEWHYNDANAKEIVDYIKALLEDRFTVCLYNTWMNDKTPVRTTKVNIVDLTVEDIKKIWGQKFFETNECLVVYKSY